jgi:anti-repressor protein
MKELIKINDNNTISGRELHKFLQIGTAYKDWFPRMAEYGFVEGVDYNVLKNEQVRLEGNRQVRRDIVDHALTISMAKELSMIQRNERGKQARLYFIECERRLKEQQKPALPDFTDPVIAARAWADEVEKKQLAEAKVAELQPKADFYDAAASSESLFSMADVAKVLDMGIGRNKLFKFLREKKILQGDNMPYQRFVDAGYFKVVEGKFMAGDNVVISKTTYVKQKGIDYIRKCLTNETVD